ncbi:MULTISPECIES: hypothetical protein [Kitasatospora]|uniref:Uncharacterized protein n=1 Tax=Kitasatospora setae (strain ATCC 33774 / DSM 43861 / JCM 3304 / KCC A-0304 / NBRC 14216 / KM-6054) TaxID=452652 RepID=E4NDN2_KITSK|nr:MULTISPECIES: hypothetical protein [Kitasatospora]BAJ29313.1 hypothetical protein KSE_35060 [Kitasatospora setae KM-6054]
MDIVHVGLARRLPPPDTEPAVEEAEAVDVLWAHADRGGGLQHITAQASVDRIDFLLYYLTRTTPAPAAATTTATAAAHRLITDAHRASPRFHRRYLPLEPLAVTDRAER